MLVWSGEFRIQRCAGSWWKGRRWWDSTAWELRSLSCFLIMGFLSQASHLGQLVCFFQLWWGTTRVMVRSWSWLHFVDFFFWSVRPRTCVWVFYFSFSVSVLAGNVFFLFSFFFFMAWRFGLTIQDTLPSVHACDGYTWSIVYNFWIFSFVFKRGEPTLF